MSKVIRSFVKFDSSDKDTIFNDYSEGELERTSFPYQGKLVDGIIFIKEESTYLVPISTIVSGKAGSSKDLDDEDEEESDEAAVELEIDEDDVEEEEKAKAKKKDDGANDNSDSYDDEDDDIDDSGNSRGDDDDDDDDY